MSFLPYSRVFSLVSYLLFIYTTGTKGRNKGEFTNLQGVAASSGSILIADSNNQCVQVISAHFISLLLYKLENFLYKRMFNCYVTKHEHVG